MKRPIGLPEDAECPERIIPTDVPGIVIWQYSRRTVQIGNEKRRTRVYSVTHEPSGVALLGGGGSEGAVRMAPSLAQARAAVAKIGDVQWRSKPLDWTQPVEVLRDNDRVRSALLAVAGFRVVAPCKFDKATREWADRNGIELEWKPDRAA